MLRSDVIAMVLVGFVVLSIASNGHSSDMVTLKGNHPPEAETSAAIGEADPNQVLSMQIRFVPRNQTELNQLLAEQQNPSSPNFHKWLKPGEYEQRFGASQSDLDAVAEWLRGEGFKVESTPGGYVAFSGTVAQAERGFAIHIRRFGDGNSYANVDDPSIPARFAGLIGNIMGFDNMMHAVPVGQRHVPPAHR